MTKSKKKILVLMDSHAILHRAFHALPNFTSSSGEPTGALYGFTSMLLKIIKELKPDYLVACYDLPEPTFRHEFYEKYKANRPRTSDELSPQINISYDILKAFEIPAYNAKGFEADDILATIVHNLKDEKDLETIIVTGDFDTLQLVNKNVKVFAMKTGIKEAILYDTKAVKEKYGFEPVLLPDFKGLMGDPSDNIIGVKGVGEKTAKILIQNFGNLEYMYKILKKDKKKFEKAGIKPRIIKILEDSEEEALFSKALAKVRKDVPVHFSIEKAVWNLEFDKEKVEKIFNNLGFKSLLNRLKSDLISEKILTDVSEKIRNDEKDLAKEAEIIFWLLDSRRTNPEVGDIFFYTKTNSLKEAMSVLTEELKNQNLFDLYNKIEKPLIPILSQMEKIGISLDVKYLKSLSKDYHVKLKKLQKEIWRLSGEEFNINSPKQLGNILFDKLKIQSSGVRKTSTGARSTRFSELLKIKDKHPIVSEIFSYRELAKLTSTYVDALPSLVDKNGRLHTSFNQTGTTTGRLSSSEPNLQNLPIRTDFGRAVRCAFVAPHGSSFVSFDYSQIELRVAASLSGDKKLKEAFRKGEDIHARVAAEVFNVNINKVDKEMRRRAKVINFGIIYGMGMNSLAKNLDCSREEARIFYDEYFHDFSGMNDYLLRIIKEARSKGYTETFLGRRRYLPEINSSIEYIRKEAERMAVNAPIQGTATGDIIKMAMIKIDRYLKEKKLKPKVNMILQIHDELLFEIKNDIIKEAIKDIRNIMEVKNLLDTPLVVDISKGSNWGEMKSLNQ